jgi:hypothetical protein
MVKDILEIPEETIPWRHTKANGILPKNICDDLVAYIDENYKTASVQNNFDSNILSIPVPKVDAAEKFQGETREFLMNLLDKEYHKKIFDLYNVDYSTGWDLTGCLELEVCTEDALNDYHNDITYGSDCITLQYYLKMDDPSRQLILSDEPSGITDGGAIMFKSEPDTYHGFKPGIGKRYNLRLRLKPNVVSPYFIQNENKNDTFGVIIDCKDMESPTMFPDLASSLGMVTLQNLKENNFNNIMLFKSRMHIIYVVKKLKSIGVKKVLYIFAGATVGDKTKGTLNEINPMVLNVSDDNTIMRQFVWIDIDDMPFNIVDDFGSDINLEKLNKKGSLQEFQIAYLHTEAVTYKFLEYIARREIPPKETFKDMSPQDRADAVNILVRTKHLLTTPPKNAIMTVKV